MSRCRTRRRGLLAGAATLALAVAATAVPALAVIPNETAGPADIVDSDDEYRGVGMFFRADGFVCTGTLINPRTVLFAAHCVNDRPEEAYHVDAIPAAWSFNLNALPGLQNWFANNFASNPDLAVFNVNRIFYNPRSLQNPQGGGFIEGDIALASLDRPAAGIPTWALLFTTLPAPASIDRVRGTGYHVDIVGYGATGNALQGAVGGIDFRRRAAENMLGGFLSLDDRNLVLFGEDSGLPQNLYQLDFDSQNREVVFDINIHRDDARPNEGTTAGGDSGGPLILDAANNALSDEDLVIGVLSGGSRFFGPQRFGSLGTTSFYQPLSLYWQYVVATNPYRYVGARAGNGNWEDPNHWVTLRDPAYRVIDSNGAVVSGLPATPELGLDGTEGDYGAVCVAFEEPGDACVDVATGMVEETIDPPAEQTSSRGLVNVADISGGGEIALPAAARLADGANATAGARVPLAADGAEAAEGDSLPAPTLANGLPGASGFVPDNIDAVTTAELRVDPRYFDVTLSQTGTTTLSSDVTIDRLTVRGDAGLTVAAAGDLAALIDINQFGGRVNVAGNLASAGDYTLFAGMLEGTGTLTAPFLTSITGVFSPATMGTTGTLTIDGNLVMASGTTLLADITGTGASDRIAVTGAANIGGMVGLGAGLTQQVNGTGRQYTILTAEDGVTGTFEAATISAILSQRFTYQHNAVLMEIAAASYHTVIDPNDAVQAAYAQLFDQNRANAALAGLYRLDFAAPATIRATFTSLAPAGEQAVRSLAGQTVNLLQTFNDGRLREADRSKAGGTIAVKGAPLTVVQAGLAPFGQPLGMDAMALQSGADKTEMRDAGLPEDVALFIAGGFVRGDVASLPGFARQTEIKGLFLSGGLEYYLGEHTMLGLAGSFNHLEAEVPLGQEVDSNTYAVSLYLRHKFTSGAVIDGQFAIGSMGFDTKRTVQLLGAGQSLTSSSDDLLVSGALGLSYDFDTAIGTISPGIEARYASVALSAVRERGGLAALAVERKTFNSTQARFGFDYEKRAKLVQINAGAQLVWEFEVGPQLLAANFAGGVGPNAGFVLDSADHTWVEFGLSANIGDGPLRVGVGIDTTIGRDTADARVLRASATYRF
ncbi:MAG: autotransporter domain-containing protein [Erythrobacter sp.]